MRDMFKKYSTKFLAVLAAAVISFSCSFPVFAMEVNSESEATETLETEETSEVQKVTSGSCGANLSWNFSGGTLSISGSGEMDNYTKNSKAPWHSLRKEILNISLPGGITNIGDFTFYECKMISTVTIPASVTKIGKYAFAYCEGMKMLSIGNGVKTIDEAAFSYCYSLTSLRIPSSVQSIGTKGFYRCNTITTVTVPSSVTSMGVSVFAYCKNLVSATINANLSELPEYTFYGCEKLSEVNLPDAVSEINDFSFEGCRSLNNVYYNGENISKEELEKKTGASVNEGNSSGVASGGSFVDNGDGTITVENTQVTESENMIVSAKTETTIDMESEISEDSKAEITVTLENEKGWTEAVNATEKVFEEQGEEKHVDVSVYLEEDVFLDNAFIESVAGKDVTVTVMTSDGSVWKIEGKNLDIAKLSGEYNLAYIIEEASTEICEKLGTSTAFMLKFLSDAQIDAEVLIRIGTVFGRQNATLFQEKKGLDRLQSVVVDNEGYAHFYLGSVSAETKYYIAMNLPDAAGEAIIPENMLAEYGNPEYTEPIKYEITGRTSSWGMNLGQVMGILGAVMAGAIILIGGIMFIWNKQRIKNGYVPKYDDEE